MKIRILLSLSLLSTALLIVSCSQVPNPDKIALKDRLDSVSYIIGLDYGKGLQGQQVEYNPVVMYKGLDDAAKGKSLIPDSIKLNIIAQINSEIEQKKLETFNNQVAQNKQNGQQFLEQNKSQQGVIVLPSGLQYKIVTQGAGKNKPIVSDSVVIHYRAMFTDGKLIDETYGRMPTSFRLTRVMKGLSEGIQLMNPGGIYEFYIPSDLGFGDKNFNDQNGNVVIPAGSSLVYRVELVNIIK
ncbi:MAG: FKBP-type peptidyl-prolyl cis-trans isomerase [Bacteroidetes bacterium]|nr:FKBP-type peptidyl-prolyl cis-trans isomerase [Bacteroidota bacterium]